MIDVRDVLRYYQQHATCDRGRVACVILDESKENILEYGYAHSIMTGETCDTHGHELVDGHCVRTIHAEQSAVARAACNGIRLLHSHAYVTKLPCKACIRTLNEAGVQSITVYADSASRYDEVVEYAKMCGIELYVHM